jgi:integral membrane protein (TIGR01906 family)
MRPRLQTAIVVTIAVLTPVLYVGNGLYLLTHEWFVRAEYARPGFPDDEFGMTTAERTRLAVVGLDSILPWNRDGIDLLREARLADGSEAFDDHEVRHMTDVRRLLAILLVLHAATLVALVVLALAPGTRPIAARSLRAGSWVTLGLSAFVGVLLLINPIWFLTGFHTIFFDGSSWRFADEDTLRRLFPDLFWSDTAALLGAFALLQAGVVLGVAWWRRRSGRTAD